MAAYGYGIAAPPLPPPPVAAPPLPPPRQKSIDITINPSSDPPVEDTPNPYPEIKPFIIRLDAKEPRRRLARYAASFESEDYYHVNEVAQFSVSELVKDYGMSSGNASFFLGEVKAEIKRVKKAMKAA